ncbi:MAG: hypothetical protein ACPGF6_07680, partial [Porticoccaceae bacterium]
MIQTLWRAFLVVVNGWFLLGIIVCDYLFGNLSFGCLFGLLCHLLSYLYINATNYDVATHVKSA